MCANIPRSSFIVLLGLARTTTPVVFLSQSIDLEFTGLKEPMCHLANSSAEFRFRVYDPIYDEARHVLAGAPKLHARFSVIHSNPASAIVRVTASPTTHLLARFSVCLPISAGNDCRFVET